MRRDRLDGLTYVALVLFLLMAYHVLHDQGLISSDSLVDSNATGLDSFPASGQSKEGALGEVPHIATASPQLTDEGAIAPPYDHYTLTQGPHSFDFGQFAIDISAGKGATIQSPINGVVSGLYVDEWGNTTLIIENSHYIVTMLHGIYTVKVGESLKLGQAVGQESNQGNTIDALGRSCRGRDCGYHTHLNIYDKLLGVNLNPLEIFSH